MTNKQIIIDGCDVSGCELYRNDNGVFAPDGTAERTELCYLTNDYCGNSPNCYYKNWQRKEQECEELNKQLVSFMSGDYCVKGCSLKQQLDQIKTEKDLLKQESDNWEQQVLFADKQIDEMQEEINLLQQYKKSKQASYESMQVEWNKAVSQNQDLLKQNEEWQKKVAELKTEKEKIKKYLGISHKTILERLEELTDFRDADREEIDKLKADKKGLKQKLLGLKSKPAAMCEQNKELIEDNLNLSKENKQLKATLIEIKKIAKGEMDNKEFMAIQYMLNGSIDDKNKVLEQILEKIKEVIPNEN